MQNNYQNRKSLSTSQFYCDFCLSLIWWSIFAFFAALLIQPLNAISTIHLLAYSIGSFLTCGVPFHIGRLRQRREYIVAPESSAQKIFHFLIDLVAIVIGVILDFVVHSNFDLPILQVILLMILSTALYVYGRCAQRNWQQNQNKKLQQYFGE